MGRCLYKKRVRDILLESLRYCQKEKGLKLYGWCIMSNHVHLMAAGRDEKLSAILRDFKKFTSKQILKTIEQSNGESRKDWILSLFNEQGENNSRNKEYQFGRQDNQPKECYGPKFSLQKLNYIHNNPVEAGIVDKPENYLYSSARDYYYGKKIGFFEIEFL